MAVKPVLDLITKLFGNKALSKTIGTRTNVITLPDASVKRLINTELNIDAANDAQLEKFKIDAEKLISEIPKMNDQELLIFKGNLQRYYDRMFPPSADVFDFQTKTPVTKKGIEQLETDLGIPKDIDPNSPLGQVMIRTKQIGKEGKNLAKEFGVEDQLRQGVMGLDEVAEIGPEATKMLNRETESMFGRDYDRKMSEGFIKSIYSKYKGQDAEDVLAYYNKQEDNRLLKKSLESMDMAKTPYSIMTPITNAVINNFIKADKIKLSPGMRENMLKGDRSGLRGKPVETFEAYFGRDALETLDNFVDEAGNSFATSEDLADEFIKLYPNLIRDGSELRSITPNKDLLTFEEKVNFLTDNLNEKGPLSKSLKEYYSKNIDPFDPDLTSYIMQYVKDGPERVREVIKNLPEDYLQNAPQVIQKIFRQELADGGSAGYDAYQGMPGKKRTTEEGFDVYEPMVKNHTTEEGFDKYVGMPAAGLMTTDPRYSNMIGYSPSGGGITEVVKQPSEVNKLASQYMQNIYQNFKDENQNGIDDRVEKFNNGGRVGYAYGSGKKLLSVLAELGKDLKSEIRKAINNANLSGDTKLDADIVVDEMLELNNIDKDVIDGYDILDAYDEAYKTLKEDPDGMLDLEGQFPGVTKAMTESKLTERQQLMQKYPGISNDLLDQILVDDNPQRKAEVLATLDEAFKMMDKGMSEEEIISTFKKTPRTKQAEGGVAYLMGL